MASGTWPERPTCHRRIQETSPHLVTWIEDYANLKAYNILPDDGGYNEQDARFHQALGIISREFSRDKDK